MKIKLVNTLFLAFPFFLLSCSQKIAVLNKGIAGNNSYDLVQRIDKDVLGEDPTLVILMVGTNDMVNSKKFVSYWEYESNLRRLLGNFQSRRIPVVMMIPPPVDTGYVFTRHKREAFDVSPNAKIDSAGRVIRRLAQQYSTGLVDLNRVFRDRGEPNREVSSLIVNEKNLGKTDGIHPTRMGYELIAREVYSYLKQHKLLKRKNRIICFGDSITFGAFMEGAGSVDGDTYPAFLKGLLSNRL